ncbi:DUF2076 domain-containing protein [Xylophilus sp. GOD-11R]|uniref:DUF2076 domain-containing protein n=1 Tax=Xylophilus sp. GOD-11R TaxID=3089814 RepID=UPI00298C291B|nr:DUF2076 domain-containing protein [Xylophilus sp. GOD-11R]WPB57101.1 DUF2076 domain-containing protein [Xylophilus sp. GOD-11R]
MTPQEHTLLDEFLGRLQAAGTVHKDAEADALIRSRLDGHADSTYLLVQRCLLVERALAEANRQIDMLRQQAQPQGGGSFLGGAPEGFGRAPSQAFSPDPRYEASATPQNQGSHPQAQPQGWRNRWFGGGAQPAAPQAAAPQASGGSSFLGQAATTAAGVAGGMFLFNGIEHLINGGGHNAANASGLMGSGDAGSLGAPMTENITENVFVDDGRAGGDQQQQGFLDGAFDDGASWADNDAADYGDDGDNFV